MQVLRCFFFLLLNRILLLYAVHADILILYFTSQFAHWPVPNTLNMCMVLCARVRKFNRWIACHVKSCISDHKQLNSKNKSATALFRYAPLLIRTVWARRHIGFPHELQWPNDTIFKTHQ